MHGGRGVVRGVHGEIQLVEGVAYDTNRHLSFKSLSKIGAVTGLTLRSEIFTSETQLGYSTRGFHKRRAIRKVLERPAKLPGMNAWHAGMRGRSRNGGVSGKRHDACSVVELP